MTKPHIYRKGDEVVMPKDVLPKGWDEDINEAITLLGAARQAPLPESDASRARSRLNKILKALRAAAGTQKQKGGSA